MEAANEDWHLPVADLFFAKGLDYIIPTEQQTKY